AAVFDALVDDRETGARTGDRGAEIDAGDVIGGFDDKAHVAAILACTDDADIGDDAGEHGWLFPSGPLVDVEPIAAKQAAVDEPPATVRVGKIAKSDVSDRSAANPDEDR